MERKSWLEEMRRDCEAQYDIRWAPEYGERWGLYQNATHLRFIGEFLGLLPPGSLILDAACGAGRYVPYLLERQHTVSGIDQSQGMLARAQERFPGVHFEKAGLQEMAYREAFDGVICMDAIENVCPEEWPLVLGNFQAALKPRGYLYFTSETIENADEEAIRQAYERARQAGLPVVYGEWPDEAVYHFHPANRQVLEWVGQAGFEVLKEGNGDEYYHVLARKR